MINWLRKISWKILGNNYYRFLSKQHKVYIDNNDTTSIGVKTYHNGAFVWKWHKDSKLDIGKYCSIANDVHFVLDSAYHLKSEITSFPIFNHISDSQITSNPNFKDFKETVKPVKSNIVIGHDVWIGMNAVILPNVKVGNGVTIMSGAIVSKDIPDYAVVGGVPAKIISYKHDQPTIDKLNFIAWWNWPESKVEANWNDFYLPINEFLDKWD